MIIIGADKKTWLGIFWDAIVSITELIAGINATVTCLLSNNTSTRENASVKRKTEPFV